MFATFKEANEYLETLIPKEYKSAEALKLERIRYLLKLLGNPHQKMKTIHIGGTSGKGSVAYFLSPLLTYQGYKTGLHISPHLQNIRERMQINNQPVPEDEFVNLVNYIKPLVEKTEKNLGLKKPTYFETTVAIAFKHFANEKVDFSVVEVGLGGRLDATNVIHPVISIITNVDLDHTDILGNTVEKIAKDKSGIIKKHVPVISGTHKLAVKKIIAKKSQENKSKLFFIGEKFNYTINKVGFSGINFDFSWRGMSYKGLRLSSPAIYQIENTSLALAAVFLLKDQGFKINKEKIYNGLASAKIPGRFEIIPPSPRLRRAGQKNPLILLDGAHNPVKIRTFIDSLNKLLPNKKFIFLVAFKIGKDIEQMLKLMFPVAESLIITEFSKVTDMGRHFTTPTEEIEKILKRLNFSGAVLIEKNSTKALEEAKNISDKNHPLIITGSLYLVGEIRDIFFPINH